MASNDTSENAHWQNNEIECLLKIWSRKEIQSELESMHQNLPVYEKISTELSESGINKSALSCRDKIKKLKFKYRRIREKKGHRKGAFRFYDVFRSVLGDNVEESSEPSSHGGRRGQMSQPRVEQIGLSPQRSTQHIDYHDQMRYSPNFASNDSVVLSDSDSDSDYDMKGDYVTDNFDEEYAPDETSSQFCLDETQPISSTSHIHQSPSQSVGTGNYGNQSNMFLHNGRVVTSTRHDTPQSNDNTHHQSMGFGPINAARMAMKRRHEMVGHMGHHLHVGRGCGLGRGLMGPPFGMMGRGRGHRGGKFARMEHAFETMIGKVMQSQKDVQERFLTSNEKQHQQHLQFELKRQELLKQEREEDRKHQMEMFQLMLRNINPTQHAETKIENQTPKPASDSHSRKMPTPVMSVSEVKAILRSSDAVCFDVDSTVLKDEGIDELAAYCGQGKQVAEWTRKAMGGGISFRVALKERLNIIKPSRQQITDFISQHPPQFSDGIRELVKSLRDKGKSVYLVSGGFRTLIEPAAKVLGIAPEHIFANKLKFLYSGDYAGFDENQPTSDSGGKPKVMQLIKDRYKHNSLVMVGDGATDLEAAPPADAFIGYGGNVCRESVKSKAPWFVTDFKELIKELDASS